MNGCVTKKLPQDNTVKNDEEEIQEVNEEEIDYKDNKVVG